MSRYRIFLVHNPESAESRSARERYHERMRYGRKTTRRMRDDQGNEHMLEVFDASDIQDVEYEELDFRAVRSVLPIRTAPSVLIVIEDSLDPDAVLSRLKGIVSGG